MTATVPTDLGVISHLYSSLIVRAPDLKVHPAAAASWKATGDTAWRFTLRDGLTFPIAWGVILHLHGDDPLFDLAGRYPIDAVNWHARSRRGVVGASPGWARSPPGRPPRWTPRRVAPSIRQEGAASSSHQAV